jgi:hypothetical protein
MPPPGRFVTAFAHSRSSAQFCGPFVRIEARFADELAVDAKTARGAIERHGILTAVGTAVGEQRLVEIGRLDIRQRLAEFDKLFAGSIGEVVVPMLNDQVGAGIAVDRRQHLFIELRRFGIEAGLQRDFRTCGLEGGFERFAGGLLAACELRPENQLLVGRKCAAGSRHQDRQAREAGSGA